VTVPADQSVAERAYAESPLPEAHTPWREATFAVVDLELTGLDPATDEIISFATVTVQRGRVQLDDARYELVRPRRMPDWDTIRIHGLREVDLEDAPALDESLDQLLEALTGRALVAHVAAIETGFLGAALEARGLDFRNPVVDTAGLAIELSRLRREPPPSNSGRPRPGVAVSTPGLGDLARWLSLPVHRPHEADGDALTTAQAFIALASHLESFEDPQTLGGLEKLSRGRGRTSGLQSILHRFGLGRDEA
jgi:DNA polymerase-3 subunit epsilon